MSEPTITVRGQWWVRPVLLGCAYPLALLASDDCCYRVWGWLLRVCSRHGMTTRADPGGA